MSEKILVTGGAGYIGSLLVPKLLDFGYRVEVIDNFMYRQTSLANLFRNPNFDLTVGDVRDDSLLKKSLANSDVVIPLAAIVGAPACAKDPQLASAVNKDSMLKLFSMISKSQRVLMPTTNSAYGTGDSENYCDERSPLNPLSLYAKDKVLVEKSLMELDNWTSFRLATVFGISPRMRLDLLVNNFVFRAVTDGFLILFEGHFKRNYVHLVDVCQAFTLGLKNPDSFNKEIFNVGLSEANISKAELCERIKNHIPNFVYLDAPLGTDPDQRNYLVSNAKIESLGFAPEVSLDEGIAELISGLPIFNHKPFTNL
jgi:nucleoside-diphosphate-sugar epimerase